MKNKMTRSIESKGIGVTTILVRKSFMSALKRTLAGLLLVITKRLGTGEFDGRK